MKKLELDNCPICLQELKSDALVKNYCKLCGMIIEENKKFCSLECRNKFKKFKGDKNGRNFTRGYN
jgi:hypothetical protein